jgi:hypothetical protein
MMNNLKFKLFFFYSLIIKEYLEAKICFNSTQNALKLAFFIEIINFYY